MLLLNLLLAMLWTLLTGELRPSNFIVGFALGYLALWLVLRASGVPRYFQKIPLLLGFVGFFLRELIVASFRVAHDVVTPRMKLRPGIVAIPLDVRTDGAITLLANLITLTPGALSLDVSPDRSVLFIHSMYASDPDAVRREIKEGFERRVLGLLR